MRLLPVAAALFACGCAPPPASPPRRDAPPDPTAQTSYQRDTEQLEGMSREAAALRAKGRVDEASAAIMRAQSVQSRLLAVPRPTLRAVEAASALDHLYGEMLLANGHHTWARLLFQKNQVRWKHWQPQTEETEKRRRLAEAAIAECDRRMTR